MPELPEVENIKLGLVDQVLNKKIVGISYSEIVKLGHSQNKMTIIKQDLDYFANNVINKNIEGLTRRGKYLYFTLSNGYIIAHFGMTGAFFVVKDIAEITNKN